MGLIIIIYLLLNVSVYESYRSLAGPNCIITNISPINCYSSANCSVRVLVFMFRDVFTLLVVLVVSYSAQVILLWMAKVGANVVLVIMKLVIHVSATLAPSL